MNVMSYRFASYVLGGALLIACGEDGIMRPPENGEFFDSSHSAARNWNETLLSAIRRDLARPPVHARNLFHSSAMMYDLWAVYDDQADTWLLGRSVGDFSCAFSDTQRNALRSETRDANSDRSIAISYAMQRLITHRFETSRARGYVRERASQLLAEMGYDGDFSSRDFSEGPSEERAAALGLYLADCIIELGLQDGANESNDYANEIYQPANVPLQPEQPGTPGMDDPNRWQPLELQVSIDQSGNRVANQPAFIGAEWGQVIAFALPPDAFTNFERDGATWPVCHDPGPPALLRAAGDGEAMPEEYQWNHSVPLYWAAHLDPDDGTMWDISPRSVGNSEELPAGVADLRDFYDALDGGARDRGHAENPATGEPYEINEVPRGDYTRVLAEFWADGPDSETPPGHWFAIVNEAVSDHPSVQKRYRGTGPELDDLEWDVKVYLALGGAVHDAAIAAWGAKGYYDYVRPISAIRFMASLGQSSDDTLPSYHAEGLPLVDNYVELVTDTDELAGPDNEHVGKIKVRTWRGPDFVGDPDADYAGVGWILAEQWWPYQRPSFVTPPFAGYVSGHSTFSRAAAEVLTEFTGDAYFPGGMGEFVAPQNNFLVFERGPSVNVVLQWATYRDASDQTSLSRIWGGIHPPVDDIPGRRMGIIVGQDAFERADTLFAGTP